MMYGLSNWGWGYGDGFGTIGLLGGGLMMLAMVAFWVLLIILAVWLIRSVFGRGGHLGCHHGRSDSDALEILRERYAKGEIDKKEFEEKKKDLDS